VVTAADLNAEQDYFREMLRRHNRYLHGCGVVCGLEVLPTEDDSGTPAVRVTAGHAIDPLGNDIHVPFPQILLLDEPGLDDECRLGEAQRLYLALRYDEVLTEPVPTLPDQCTPVSAHEPSRAQASFELACLCELPEGCREMPPCGTLNCEILRTTPTADQNLVPPNCPPGNRDPWVVLAALELDGRGHVVDVDYSVRRRVLSVQFLAETLRCLLPKIDDVMPKAGVQGDRMIAFIIGERLDGATAVRFAGSGVTAEVLPQYGRDTLVVAWLDIAPDAPLGPRTFEVTTPRGIVDSVACGVAFVVLPMTGYPYPYPYPYAYGYPGAGDTFSVGIGGDLL
jgi:hypothetical protein